MNKKSYLISLLSVVIIACALFLAPINVKATKAETYGDFTIVGASVRYPSNDGITGLRFTARISASDFEEIKSDADEAAFKAGIVMLKTSLVGDELTVNSDRAIVADLTEKYFSVQIDGVDYYEFRCYIYNIPDTQYNAFISARGYITAGDKTYYTQTVSRSMTQVAQIAVNAGESITDLSEYISGQTANYRRKLYVQTDEGYSLYSDETVSGNVNEAVSAPEFAGYSFKNGYAQNEAVEHILADGTSNFVAYYDYAGDISTDNSQNYIIGKTKLSDLFDTSDLTDNFDLVWQSNGEEITDSQITEVGSLSVCLKATKKDFNKSITVYSATLNVKQDEQYTAWQTVDTQNVTVFNNYGIANGMLSVCTDAPERSGLSYYKISGSSVAPAVKINPALTSDEIADYANGYMLFEIYLGGSNSSVAYFGRYTGSAQCESKTIASGTWYSIKLPMSQIVANYASFQNYAKNSHDGKLFSFTSEVLGGVDIYFSQIVLVKNDDALTVTDETSQLKVVKPSTEVLFSDWFSADGSSWSVDGSVVANLDPRSYGEGVHTVNATRKLGDLNFVYAAYSAKYDYVSAWQSVNADDTAMAYQYGNRKPAMFEVAQNVTIGGRTGNFYHVFADAGVTDEAGIKVAPAHSKEVLSEYFSNGYIYFDYYIVSINGYAAPNYMVPTSSDANWSRFGTYNSSGSLGTCYDVPAPVATWNRMYLPMNFILDNYDDFANLTATSNYGKLMYFVCSGSGPVNYYVSEIGITDNADLYLATSVRVWDNYSFVKTDVMTVTDTAPDGTKGNFYKFNATQETALKAYTLRSSEELSSTYANKYLCFKFYIDDAHAEKNNSQSIGISFAFNSLSVASISGTYEYGKWHTVKVPVSAIVDSYSDFNDIGGTGHNGKLFKLDWADGVQATVYLAELTIVD